MTHCTQLPQQRKAVAAKCRTWSAVGQSLAASVCQSVGQNWSTAVWYYYYATNSRRSAVQAGLLNHVVAACKAEVKYVLRTEQTTQQFPRQTERRRRWHRCGRVRQLPASSRSSSHPPCHPHNAALLPCEIGCPEDDVFSSSLFSSTRALMVPRTITWADFADDSCCCYWHQRSRRFCR